MTATVLDFSIDDVDASTKYFTAYRIIKPLQPQVNQSIIDIPKMDGVIQSSRKFKQYPLTIKGILEGSSPDDLIANLEDLIDWLHSDIDKQLIFSNQSDRYWNTQYLDDPEVIRDGEIAYLDLNFTCNDPFAYDITPDSDDQNIIVNDDNYVIANSGHYYAFPVITITFNQAQNHIYVANNGIDNNRFDISKSFESGDELEIDCKNHTVKHNGSADYEGMGDGGLNLAAWILLAKGDNSISVGTDDPDIDIDINITFSKVYFY